MTADEVHRAYQLSQKLLRTYEKWQCDVFPEKGLEELVYDDSDIGYLSFMLTLYDVGFQKEEVEAYMKLLFKGSSTEEQRLDILSGKRRCVLEEIHQKEMQLSQLDYLRYTTSTLDQSK